MRKTIFILILFLTDCVSDKPVRIDPQSIITSHVWESSGFIINGKSYDSLVQDLGFHQTYTTPDLTVHSGDTLKKLISYQLLFTDGNIMREIQNYSTYYRCDSCPGYILLNEQSFDYQDTYAIDSGYIYLAFYNIVSIDSITHLPYRYQFIGNQELKLFNWKNVQNNSRGAYDVILNDIPVPAGDNIPIDIIFKASL